MSASHVITDVGVVGGAPGYLKAICAMASMMTTLSPSSVLLRMLRRKRDTGEIAWITLWTSALAQTLWVTYYFLRPNDDTVALWLSVFGAVTFFGYLFVHYSVSSYRDRPQRRRMLYYLLVTIVLWGTAFTTIVPKKRRADYAGVVCNIVNLIMLMAPLSTLGEVFRTQSARTIPSLPALASTFGAACWLLWGYLDNDIFVCVPSVIALLLGSVQLSLIGFYGSGAPKHP
ncbi:Sugar transporter SWEET [Plasmodiophora brassicae]|uniref:Sugar transporter SWEET1 n=1 Tax=Plasmodiophora brassicae TaxID=37360 RepID=A0A0G4IZA9_PLABS|nr:hypothetical protein PBRA_001528 [Plasmodiophora brassicae]SPQ94026.1 unnamed protein product [Plasmodiophora brassicae]